MKQPLDNPARRQLLPSAGFDPDNTSFEAIGRGGNNQVYIIKDSSRSAVVKLYFKHEGDLRDRRRSEFDFSRFVWDVGNRRIAQPLHTDAELGASIFEYIEGVPAGADDISQSTIMEAMDFIGAINADRQSEQAAKIAAASEAQFSLSRHISQINKRIQALSDMPRVDTIDSDLATFLAHDLARAWGTLSAETTVLAESHKVSISGEIPQQERCLSPSDFGFHNILLDPTHNLWFFDFEYAGWDDPAKLIADFFCQKKLPVPINHTTMVIESILSKLGLSHVHAKRAALLLPVYQIKWCCILLNVFLPAGRARRTFSGNTLDDRPYQLAKARDAFSQLDAYTACRQQLLNYFH